MIESFPKYKRKKVRMPYLIDLVEDNVRSRMIYPCIIFVFFILIMFFALPTPPLSEEREYVVNPLTAFNSQYKINQAF